MNKEREAEKISSQKLPKSSEGEQENYGNVREYLKNNKFIVVPVETVDKAIQKQIENSFGDNKPTETNNFKTRNIGKGELDPRSGKILTFIDSIGNICELDFTKIPYNKIQSITQKDLEMKNPEGWFINELYDIFTSLYAPPRYPDGGFTKGTLDCGNIISLKEKHKQQQKEEQKEKKFDI